MSTLPDDEMVGWQVTDPDGNVVQSGTVSRAYMTAELAQMLGFIPTPNKEGA
jgi:hypothetical protein